MAQHRVNSSLAGGHGSRHVCWISDSPDTPSGFGNVTRAVCTGLAKRGYRVSILGWQTQEYGAYEGCQVYPIGREALGADALFSFLVRHRPSIVVALADVWWLPYMSSPHVRRQMELIDAPWALYFPIDGTRPDGSLPTSWLELLREVDFPVAMTRFGQRVVREAGIDADYIPHGVDLDTFCPPADRDAVKSKLGLGNRFVVLSDSRNQPRKLLHRLLDIFSKVASIHPEALLHLHTDPDDEFSRTAMYSYNLRADVAHFGLSDQVRFSEGFVMRRGAGLTTAELARYYQSADVHLLASSGEGFGLPTLQAAAAGVVPLAVDYSANPELLADHGQAIPVAEWIDNEFGIRRAMIDVGAAATAISRFCEDRALLGRRSEASRQFALQYGWPAIVDQWDQLLHDVCGSRRGRRRIAPHDSQFIRVVHGDQPGSEITMTMLRREAGRLEASITADARAGDAMLSCPTVPPACQVSRVKVPRELGLVCVALPDLDSFARLRAIFPILHCFVPIAADRDDLVASDSDNSGVEYVVYGSPGELRYQLARVILLLDSRQTFPDQLLAEAALFGVPGIVSRRSPAHCYWPDSGADSDDAVVIQARLLLTNPVLANRVSIDSRGICRRLRQPEETAIADSLREQHRSERAIALAGA